MTITAWLLEDSMLNEIKADLEEFVFWRMDHNPSATFSSVNINLGVVEFLCLASWLFYAQFSFL